MGLVRPSHTPSPHIWGWSEGDNLFPCQFNSESLLTTPGVQGWAECAAEVESDVFSNLREWTFC